VKPDMMSMMMQMMPLMQMMSSSKVSLKDILTGSGQGGQIRSQLLMTLPGNMETKQQILTVLQKAESVAKLRRTDLLDVLLGTSADPALMDELKKGIRKL